MSGSEKSAERGGQHQQLSIKTDDATTCTTTGVDQGTVARSPEKRHNITTDAAGTVCLYLGGSSKGACYCVSA